MPTVFSTLADVKPLAKPSDDGLADEFSDALAQFLQGPLTGAELMGEDGRTLKRVAGDEGDRKTKVVRTERMVLEFTTLPHSVLRMILWFLDAPSLRRVAGTSQTMSAEVRFHLSDRPGIPLQPGGRYLAKIEMTRQASLYYRGQMEQLQNARTSVIIEDEASLFLLGYLKGVTHLTFGERFNAELYFLPETLTHLTFGRDFRQSVDALTQCVALKELTFGERFDRSVDVLESCISLTHLTFGDQFDGSVDRLPEGLTHLTFGRQFNYPMVQLPKGLTHLTFGDKFNNPVDQLPASLTHLTFGREFNMPVDALTRCVALKKLIFGDFFNRSVNHLPEGLTHLTFGVDFTHSVNSLPEGLTHLTFGMLFNEPLDHLPTTLTHLTFGWEFNHPVDALARCVALEEVVVSYKFKHPVDFLGPNVRVLRF